MKIFAAEINVVLLRRCLLLFFEGYAGGGVAAAQLLSKENRGLQKARRRALTCAASLSINNMLCPRGAEFYFTSSLLTFAPRRTM